MLSWLPALLGLIPAGLTTIQGITTAISNEKIAVINAKTEQERISAQERLSALQTQRDVLVADVEKSNIDVWIRSLIAIGPASILLKILLWDKVIGSLAGCVGRNTEFIQGCPKYITDPLDVNLWWVIGAVISLYCLTIPRK